MQNFIKFRYFLLIGLLLACGGKEKSSQSETTTDEAVEEESAASGSEEKVILFFGDSLTAGYQLDPEEAFPARVQEIIDSLQLPYTVVNAGLSGETTASGKNRLSWILKQPVDIFVLELGGNDGLRGIPLSETRRNLQSMIDLIENKNANIEIVLVGMQIPPNMGQDYTAEFREIFPELAEKNSLHLIPFLLEDVGGVPELNLEDGIHPNPEGHKIVAGNVWEVLGPLVQDQKSE